MRFNKKNLLKKTKENLHNRFSLQLTSAMCCKAVHRSGQHRKAMHKRGLACPLRGSFSATYHIHVGHLCPLSSCSTWSKSLCTVTLLHNHNWDCCSCHEELKTAACQPDVKKSHMKYGGGVCFSAGGPFVYLEPVCTDWNDVPYRLVSTVVLSNVF